MNYLPEWATMIIFALFFSVIISLIYFANIICGVWNHAANFGKLIKNLYNPKKFNNDPTSDPEDTLPIYKKWSTYYNPFFVIMYFIGAIVSSIIVSPFVVTVYTFFKALGANYIVREKNNNGIAPEDVPKLNVFSFIKSALYYKKTFIIILVMLNLMGATNEYLGTSYLPGVIIALLILIFGLKILQTDIPEKLYPVVNTNFPPLSQPKVDLKNEKKTEICKEEEDYPNLTKKIIKTITGFLTPNVLDTNTAKGNNSHQGGGKSFKNVPKPTPTLKPKIKKYNLKLV